MPKDISALGSALRCPSTAYDALYSIVWLRGVMWCSFGICGTFPSLVRKRSGTTPCQLIKVSVPRKRLRLGRLPIIHPSQTMLQSTSRTAKRRCRYLLVLYWTSTHEVNFRRSPLPPAPQGLNKPNPQCKHKHLLPIIVRRRTSLQSSSQAVHFLK